MEGFGESEFAGPPRAGRLGLLGGLAPWNRSNPSEISLRSAAGALLVSLAVFLVLDLLWSAGALGVELALGDRLLQHRSPDTDKNAADALWHVATALAIALPARRAWVWVFAPAAALGLDIDHVFGGLLPTVVIRSAHDVFFLALLATALMVLRGSATACVAVGAVLEHLAVDGGGFPLFAPFSVSYFSLPFPVQCGLIAAAALLFFVAAHPVGDLRKLRSSAPVAASIVGLSAVVWLLWPSVAPFTHT